MRASASASGALLLPFAANRTFAANAVPSAHAGSAGMPVRQPHGPAHTNPDIMLLEEIERAGFEYFWREANPKTGLVRDRANANGSDNRIMGSIAATGFGLTALCIGHQRGYAPKAAIEARVQKTLDFLANHVQHVRGFFYHYVDIRNGKRFGASEISPVDMAILLCGVLTCRSYFSHAKDQSISRNATAIYYRVEWPWALNGGETFALEWTPESRFSPFRWDSYCESMMLYLLALGSPTNPIAPDTWRSIRRPWLRYGKYVFISSPAPLFVHQFSHAWFDFRGKQDGYADYFANSVLACAAHRQFCKELNHKFSCYSGEMWGITASDSQNGYVAWGGPPIMGPIDGTLVPSAATGSLPFVYKDSMAVLHNLRRKYGRKIWKRYGFVDAFNPLTGWVDPDVVGIDVGISTVMAENARSQFVWNTFMQNQEAVSAMESSGFNALGRAPLLYSMGDAANADGIHG